MSNKIIHLAIHDLIRKESKFTVELGQENLAIGATAQRLVNELHKIYNRRSSKSFGKFSSNENDYPAQKFLREYMAAKERNFTALTKSLMTTLSLQASRKSGATGGHVFFAHVEREQREYILVAIVNDKLSAAMTKGLDVTDVEHLDVDGFRFAGQINITSWLSKDERYIGFIKGKGNVSEYFQEFLGCEVVVQDKLDTRGLVTALKQFADVQNMELPRREAFLAKARSICERSAVAHTELDFTALANELTPEDPDPLLHHLADSDRSLTDGFVPHRGTLGSLVKFEASTPLWSVRFDREALTSGKLKFNAKAKTLTITDLPPELIEQLSAEMTVNAAH